MNKRKVEQLLPKAIEALNHEPSKIKKTDEKGVYIEKGFRGQISSFGATVTMGSFRAAVAFFGNNGESDVERSELIRAMYYMVKDEWLPAKEIVGRILSIQDNTLLASMKEDFINASVALKLALNAFRLEEKSKTKTK